MREWFIRWLVAGLGVAVAASLLSTSGLLEFLRRPTFDGLVRVASSSPPREQDELPRVVVVALDAQSMRAFKNEWPWPRSRFAKIIDLLGEAGARSIAFDVDFSVAREAEEDAALQKAIERSGRVVLSAHREFQTLPEIGELEVATLPLERLAAGAVATGAALVEIDPDGLIRKGYRSREIAGRKLPSLAEAALAVAERRKPVADHARPVLIDFRRDHQGIQVISAIDLLENRHDAAQIRNAIVMIGASAVEFQDLWPTPLRPNEPGVIIQAQALRTFAAADAGIPILRATDRTGELSIVLLVSLLAAGIGLRPQRTRLIGLGLLGAAPLVASFGSVGVLGLLFDPLLPMGVVAVHYTLGLESVRRRLGQSLAEREMSLTTLFDVGQATTAPTPSTGVDVALALLGEVVSASGVGLLRTNENGELDGARLEWKRAAGRPVGDIETGTIVLSDRQTKMFEGSVPGSDVPGGLAVYTPLFAGPTAVGVLVVEQEQATPLNELQLRTIAAVGTQLALSVENMRLFSRLQQTFHSSISSLASAVEARDGYTDQHCRRLAVFSVIMGEQLGISEEELQAIELGALLHDVGKIGIRDAVLLKDGRLTQAEREEIEKHAVIGHGIVKPITGISDTTVACVRHHHERWNGTGYPDGLAGEEIPLGARIVSLVDVWDALSTARPYKQAYAQGRVREILQKDSGVRFEPALVDLFFEILDERGEELLDLIARTTGEDQ